MDSDNSKSTAIKNLLESSQHNKYDEMKNSTDPYINIEWKGIMMLEGLR